MVAGGGASVVDFARGGGGAGLEGAGEAGGGGVAGVAARGAHGADDGGGVEGVGGLLAVVRGVSRRALDVVDRTARGPGGGGRREAGHLRVCLGVDRHCCVVCVD